MDLDFRNLNKSNQISQNLPNFYSADDLCYGRDTKDKLTLKQKNWLETFIDVWDVVNQYT